MLILNTKAWMTNYLNYTKDDTVVLDNAEVVDDIFKRFKSCFTSDDRESLELFNFIYGELSDNLGTRLDYRSDNYEKEVGELSAFVEFLLNKEVNRVLVHPLYVILNKNLEEKQYSSCMYTIENLGDIARIDVGNYQYLHSVELIDMMSYAGYHHYISDDAMKQYHKSLTMDTLSMITSVITGRRSRMDIEKKIDIPQNPQIMSNIDIPGRDAIYEHLKGIVTRRVDCITSVRKLIELINPDNITDFRNCNKFTNTHLVEYYELYYRVVRDIATNLRGYKKQEKCMLKLIEYTRKMYVSHNHHALVGMMMRLCIGVTFLLGLDSPYTRSSTFKPYFELLKMCDDEKEMQLESTDLLTAMLVCKETHCTMLDKVGDISCLRSIISNVIVDDLTTKGLQESLETVLLEMESPSHLMTTLTEAFEVLRDGTIKVTLPEKTTFMNEYAVNHRLLKYNDQHGDYEGMKYNLVYHMILIENIEKNVLYNRKVKKDSELYKDAQKAHSFAKNDISIYLPKVKEHDRNFDINKFYRQIKADRATITINGVETALGLKQIFSSILLK